MADRSRISPLLDKCLMRVCAKTGYQSAERDIKALMGLEIGHSSLHRYVQKQELELPEIVEIVESSSIDGGKIRMRGAKGEKSYDRDYKIARLNSQWYGATYLDNGRLIDWVNSQKQAVPIVCRGDGHDGVWNIFAEIGTERMEILDWYHLKEHLCGVGGSLQRLKIAESLLWAGNVTETIPLFKNLKKLKAVNFIKYIEKHRERIINYNYWTNIALQPIAIGSGDVESAVKQMSMRVKLSGARWSPANVNQILSLRCAYLNGVFDIA
jgi:hypothetical protein